MHMKSFKCFNKLKHKNSKLAVTFIDGLITKTKYFIFVLLHLDILKSHQEKN